MVKIAEDFIWYARILKSWQAASLREEEERER